MTSPTASGAACSCPPAAAVVLPIEQGVLLLPVPDEAGVEDDVAVDHLAGQRVGADAGHRVGLVLGDPAERAIIRVLGVEIIAAGLFPADGDRVLEADLLERLVPLADPFLDVGAVLDRHRVLDVPDDLLAGAARAWRAGLAFSSRQRLIIRTKFESGSVMPKSLLALRKWPTRSSAIRGR